MGCCVILWNIMKYMLKPFVDVCVCCLLSIIPDCSSGSVAGICCNCTRCMMQPWAFPSRSSEPDVQEAGSVSWIVNPWFQWPTPVRSWALLIPSLGCVLLSWRGLQCYRCLHSGSLESNVVRIYAQESSDCMLNSGENRPGRFCRLRSCCVHWETMRSRSSLASRRHGRHGGTH